jgi:hypothetical protein
MENAPSKTDAARAALWSISCASVIARCAILLDPASQLAFSNAHHDERGFANMHI